MTGSLLDIATRVLAENKTGLHVREIAEQAVARRLTSESDVEGLAQRLSSQLSSHVRTKGRSARVAKVKNKAGGFKKGIYRLREVKAEPPKPVIPEAPKRLSTQFTGRAGEFGVLSELLFWGFDASVMTVDQGIDVVASKENKFFLIQVKTAYNPENGVFTYTISPTAFEANNAYHTFYIFVLRRILHGRWLNEYVVFPSHEIQRFLDHQVIAPGNSISVRLSFNENSKLMLNKREDVTRNLNNFSLIK